MRYWIAYNGWMGNGQVGVFVEADTEEDARAQASQALCDAEGNDHEEGYFEITQVEEIHLPWVGEID